MFLFGFGVLSLGMAIVQAFLFFYLAVHSWWVSGFWAIITVLVWLRHHRRERQHAPARHRADKAHRAAQIRHAEFWARYEAYREHLITDHIDRELAAGRGVTRQDLH